MVNSKDPKTKKTEARRRAECILKARGGLKSVAEAASELGVSRKTYYKWEAKAFASMIKALTEKEPGRPAPPPGNQELQRLRKRVKFLEEQNAKLEQKENLIRTACKLKIEMIEGRMKKKQDDWNFD